MQVNPAEYTVCAWVEFAFKSLTALIDWVLKTIEMEYKSVVAALNTLCSVVIEQTDKAIDTLTEIINNCIEAGISKMSADDLDWLGRVRSSLCEMLTNCRIVVDILANGNKNVAADGSSYWLDLTNLESIDTPPYFAKITGSDAPYVWFKRMVCNFSLKDMVDQAGELSKAYLAGLIDKALYGDGSYGISWVVKKAQQTWNDYQEYINQPLNEMIPYGMFKSFWTKMFDWIPTDMANPETMTIFDLMDLLDEFGNCAFSICNFVTSVLTYKEDKTAKVHVDWESGMPTPPTVLTALYSARNSLNELTDGWKNSAESKVCVGG